MNEEVLQLVLKYPELIDKLTVAYRKELLVLYFKLYPVERKASYQRVADVYNKASQFKVTNICKAIQEIFGLKEDNASMQIMYAKKKGLIIKSVKTNHAKGYRQKNYVPKSTKGETNATRPISTK